MTRGDRPFLVALEGIDGAGKATQAQLLCADLAATGRSVSVRSYPVYRSFFGSAIRRMLDGVEGPSAAQVDPRSMALWYALDRRDDLRHHPPGGDVVVLNRFTLSNAVYQAARTALPPWQETGRGSRDPGDAADVEVGADNVEVGAEGGPADEVFRWVQELEHERLGIPVPDLTVVLDVPPEESFRRADARSRDARSRGAQPDSAGGATGPDVYERAGGLLTAARARYQRAAEQMEAVVTVPCLDPDGEVRTVEAVHADVRAHVASQVPASDAQGGRKRDPNIRSDVASRG